MRSIHRAAVTGLFAIWLAPLSANAEVAVGRAFRTDRSIQADRAATEARRQQETSGGEAVQASRRD